MAEFKLPNGVTIDGKHYNNIILEEMTGKQQNALIIAKPKTAVDHIEPVLKDLIIDIRTDDEESITQKHSIQATLLHLLPIQDIQFILVKLREITFDADYYLDLTCPNCNHVNKAKLLLSDLEIKPSKFKLEPSAHILPKSNLPFTYKPLSLQELKRNSTVSDEKRITENLITELTSSLLGSLGDNQNVTAAQVSDLKAKDIQFIQQNAPEYARIDTDIEHECSKCGQEFKSELPALAADFLLPSRT